MSFTLDLILTDDIPKEANKAWGYIGALRDEYYDDETGAHEKLIKLESILTDKYPCLCSFDEDDPEIESCVWADGPMIGNFASKMGMLAISWSKADEVFPFVLQQAHALDITVADGQSSIIYRPGEEVEQPKKYWWKFW